MKQEPAEATMRNCHGNAVGILVIHGEEDVNRAAKAKMPARKERKARSDYSRDGRSSL